MRQSSQLDSWTSLFYSSGCSGVAILIATGVPQLYYKTNKRSSKTNFFIENFIDFGNKYLYKVL